MGNITTEQEAYEIIKKNKSMHIKIKIGIAFGVLSLLGNIIGFFMPSDTVETSLSFGEEVFTTIIGGVGVTYIIACILFDPPKKLFFDLMKKIVPSKKTRDDIHRNAKRTALRNSDFETPELDEAVGGAVGFGVIMFLWYGIAFPFILLICMICPMFTAPPKMIKLNKKLVEAKAFLGNEQK